MIDLPKPYWQSPDGAHVLYCASCESVFPMVQADCVLTDPPYGIGEAAGKNKSRGLLAVSKDYGNLEWDNKPATAEQIAAIRRVSKWQIIFGGNYFELPPSSCWLVWDKMNGETDFADCELAWTNLKRAVRKISFRWHGMIRDEDGRREHPTQKPVAVMEWALGFVSDARTILDPFAGSGTTAVACIRTGRRSISIEKEEKYCAIAKRRMEEAIGVGTLFDPKVVEPDLFSE